MILMLLIACGGAEAEAPRSGGPPPAVVQVDEARAGDLSDAWPILAEVVALERAELAAGASGSLTRVTVREGDRVAQGDLLAEVDTDLAAAELQAAKAEVARLQVELEQAQQTLARVGRVEAGVMAADEVERTRTQARSLEAAVQRAEAQERLAAARLGRHRVRAPFAGVVARRRVDPGDWVDPGVGVLDLVRVDTVELRVDAPLQLAANLAAGDPVQLEGGGTGEIIAVVPALDPVSRTSTVRVRPTSPLPTAIPGSSMQAVFDVKRTGGVLVPRDALVSGPTEDRVFKVVEGVARAIPVELLAKTADSALVMADELAVGDLLVVRGNERLRPDQAVQVSP